MTVKVTYHGHATFSLSGNSTDIVIDPFFTDNPVAKVTAQQVAADYILLSHGHGDHVGDAVAIAKRTGAQVVANFEIASWLSAQGVEKVHPLHIGGGANFPFGRVKMTIAHHGSGLPDGAYGGNPAGFLIHLADRTIYFSGDTALTYDMSWLADEGVDLAILCVGDNFTMGPDDAYKAIKLIQPKRVIPCHYDTWPYIEIDVQAFAERVLRELEVEVAVLDPEDTYEV